MARFCDRLVVAFCCLAVAVIGESDTDERCGSSGEICTRVNGQSLIQSRYGHRAFAKDVVGSLIQRDLFQPNESEKSPSVVFHVLWDGELPAWADGETVNVFVPDQERDFNASCDQDLKPLNWSRTWEPKGWWAAQRQYLPSLQGLLDKHPDADYYMLVDSDTVVFPRNLHALLSYLEREVLADGDDLYMGHGFRFYPKNPDHLPNFIMSGGGVLLRGRTLRALSETGTLTYCSRMARTEMCWYHLDWTLASCLQGVGIKATGHVGFQQFIDECPECCTNYSIACHPVKSMEEQRKMLRNHLERTEPVMLPSLTKTLAEPCGKHYSWAGKPGSYCIRPESNLYQTFAEGEANLCIDDRIVPELFVLGAQKAGTTSLASQLINIPGILGRRLEKGTSWKEGHVFDKDDWEVAIKSWRSAYPKCTNDTRIVTFDATPNYMFIEAAPQRIKQSYGHLSHRLNFAVVLREPLDRMHSAFYHYKADAKLWGVPHCEVFDFTFADYVTELLESNATVPKHPLLNDHDDPFLNSMYAPQLENYFSHFDSMQFFIAPFLSSANSGLFALQIAKTFRLPAYSESIFHCNSHKHPPMEEELSAEQLTQLRKFAKKHAGAKTVARVLAGHSGRRADLLDFEGKRNSVASIAKWLTASW